MECVRTKTLVADRLPGLRQAWWFGARGASYDQLDGVVRAAHGTGLAERARGLLRAARGGAPR
jgi:hypothetical protein